MRIRVGDRRVDAVRVAFAVFAVAVAGALVVGAATSAVAFGAYNFEWEGTSDLRTVAEDAGAETAVIQNTSEYDAYGNGTTAVVVAPTDAYDDADIAAMEAFLARGGTLVVADRDGTANDLLSGVDATARLDGAPLRDERHHLRDPALVEANNVSEHGLTAGVESVTLNHGTALEAGNATVLVATSGFGYLDRNRNERLDDAETLGSYPVAAVEPVGEGRVVVVSDFSAFINVMADRPGNRAVLENLAAESETVVVDTSHSGELPPLVVAMLFVRASPVAQALLLGGGLAGIAVWARRDPDDGGPAGDASPEGRSALAAEEHSDLEERRLRDLIEGIKAATPELRDE